MSVSHESQGLPENAHLLLINWRNLVHQTRKLLMCAKRCCLLTRRICSGGLHRAHAVLLPWDRTRLAATRGSKKLQRTRAAQRGIDLLGSFDLLEEEELASTGEAATELCQNTPLCCPVALHTSVMHPSTQAILCQTVPSERSRTLPACTACLCDGSISLPPPNPTNPVLEKYQSGYSCSPIAFANPMNAIL